MLHYMSSNSIPLKFVSCGKFITDIPWSHSRRKLNTFVLLVGCEGTLYIEQDSRQYEMGKDKYVLLFPDQLHQGYKICEPGLTYYWCHFFTRNKYSKILDDEKIKEQVLHMRSKCFQGGSTNSFFLPEFNTVYNSQRVAILFRQLLDYTSNHFYTDYVRDYALSLIAMELTHQYITNYNNQSSSYESAEYRFSEIMEWIRINYDKNISAKEVAEKFNYNPDYLSGVIKNKTGYSLINFIHKTKINVAKKYLLDSQYTVQDVSSLIGYDDDKYFMKVFKKVEGVTPTQYRNAFNSIHLNKK